MTDDPRMDRPWGLMILFCCLFFFPVSSTLLPGPGGVLLTDYNTPLCLVCVLEDESGVCTATPSLPQHCGHLVRCFSSGMQVPVVNTCLCRQTELTCHPTHLCPPRPLMPPQFPCHAIVPTPALLSPTRDTPLPWGGRRPYPLLPSASRTPGGKVAQENSCCTYLCTCRHFPALLQPHLEGTFPTCCPTPPPPLPPLQDAPPGLSTFY